MTPSRLICSATMTLRMVFSTFVLAKFASGEWVSITATNQLSPKGTSAQPGTWRWASGLGAPTREGTPKHATGTCAWPSQLRASEFRLRGALACKAPFAPTPSATITCADVSLGLELRVQGDLGNTGERFRHGAAALRLLRGLVKARLVEPGHLAAHAERHLGDRGCAVHHVHGACGGGLDARHRLAGLFQSGREGHAEAGRVRRGDQLLGVGALRSFEPGGEGVRPAERAARGPEVSLAVLELSFPDGRGVTGGHRLDS